VFCGGDHGVLLTERGKDSLRSEQERREFTHQYVCRQHIHTPDSTPFPIRRHLPRFLQNIAGFGDTSHRIREKLTGSAVPVQSEESAHSCVEHERCQIWVSSDKITGQFDAGCSVMAQAFLIAIVSERSLRRAIVVKQEIYSPRPNPLRKIHHPSLPSNPINIQLLEHNLQTLSPPRHLLLASDLPPRQSHIMPMVQLAYCLFRF
jgi:hypothetical protein